MVTALERAASGLVPTRFRQLDDAWLLTNDFGRHVFLTADELARLDRLHPDDPLRQRLRDAQFLTADLDAKAAAAHLAERTRFLRCGPNLHIFVVTLRCNHTCQYCHASRAPMDATDCDMDIATAERAVDFAFQSTSPALTLEFQGGEPLANWEVVEHIVEYALQKNALARRSLMFALVSNLTLLDDARLDYLIDRRVQISTSLDGPADLHDAVRQWRGGPSHDTTVAWIQRIHARYEELSLDPRQYRVEALPTVTRPTLPRARDLIDHYRAIGMRSIYLRPLDPFGWAATTKQKLGYDTSEFLAFYADALSHIVALNRLGHDFVERTAALIMAKVLGGHEPNFLDLRSPCGAGIGQVAYGHDGGLYTCDEGRMVGRAGDDCFRLGHVAETPYRDAIAGPVVRATVLASVLEGQPHCSTCAYKPWCGVCPVHNYCEQGSLHGRMAESSWCRLRMGVFDLLLGRLRRADAFERGLFERWATPRALDHFVRERAA